MRQPFPHARCLALLALVAVLGCDDAAERFEEIGKLRALGVAANPVVGTAPLPAAPAPTTATLTIFAAVPLAATVSIEPYVDQASKFAPPIPLVVEPGSEAYEDHAAFRLFSVRATLTLPPLVPISLEPGFARLRYGLRFRSGDQVENIVGTYLVYPPGAPEIAKYTAASLTVDITSPTPGAAVTADEAPLEAGIGNPANEKIRIGWFVSDGKVKNRRARTTKWETEGVKGAETVLITGRGLASGAFALKVVDVAVP